MKNLFIPALIAATLLAPAPAFAKPSVQVHQNKNILDLSIGTVKTSTITIPKPPAKPDSTTKPAEAPKAPEPAVYTVVEGDSLSTIGTAHNVEWQRLWSKNTQLDHPDRINVGDKITIPLPTEQLQRDLPAVVSLPAETPGVVTSTVAPSPGSNAGANYGGGNTYDYGYCTWYVKNRRGASIPNMLGNANTWYSRAAAQGMAVGSVPQAGAVATTTAGAYGHVAYVESVNGDGTINISEMNAPGWGVVSSRTARAADFLYIY